MSEQVRVDVTRLERSYRRILAWYPRSFRADSQEEILAVLLDTAVGMWLWLAWANGRGEDWARLNSAACFGLLTLTIAGSLSEHAAAYAPATLIAAAVVWAIGLASVMLIFTPAAWRYYRSSLAEH